MEENHEQIRNLQISKGVTISTLNNCISINIEGMSRLAFVDYSEEMLELIKKARFRVLKWSDTHTMDIVFIR